MPSIYCLLTSYLRIAATLAGMIAVVPGAMLKSKRKKRQFAFSSIKVKTANTGFVSFACQGKNISGVSPMAKLVIVVPNNAQNADPIMSNICKIQPCNNCPYRKDAPRRHWSKEQFLDLLRSERDTIGVTYGCHKKDGMLCTGWVMNQDSRRFQSIALRMLLSQRGITREFLDTLHSPAPMFETVKEMCEANYKGITKLV